MGRNKELLTYLTMPKTFIFCNQARESKYDGSSVETSGNKFELPMLILNAPIKKNKKV